MMVNVSLVLFYIAFWGLFTVVVGYPLLVWTSALFKPGRQKQTLAPRYSVSLIIVVHNGADLVIPKFHNSIALNYPEEQLEIIFFSDGSNDGTAELLSSLNHNGLRTLIAERHQGKYKGLNSAARIAVGEILVFTDVDAMLEADALTKIVRHFANDAVGGVCGRRRVGERKKPLSSAQDLYVALDDRLKRWESQLGNITANDGKLYALRRSLFQPIPPGVTDDLYAALSVTRQKKQFIYEPDAVAIVKLPSRDSHHEVVRRRRIVSQSLNGIRCQQDILDPRKYGGFAIRLLVNKVLRRFLPLFLLVLFPATLMLHGKTPFFTLLFWAQLAFYVAASAIFVLPTENRGSRLVKIVSTAYYICVGMTGTMLGLIDFLRKPPPAKWTPIKKD